MNSINCYFCSKTVYKAEERIVESKIFHPACVNKWSKSETITPSIQQSSRKRNEDSTREKEIISESEAKKPQEKEESIFSRSIREIIELNKKENEEKKLLRQQKELEESLFRNMEDEKAKCKIKDQIEQRKVALAEAKRIKEEEIMTCYSVWEEDISPTQRIKNSIEVARREKAERVEWNLADELRLEETMEQCKQDQMRESMEARKRELYEKRVKRETFHLIFVLSEIRLERKRFGPSPRTLPKELVFQITRDYYHAKTHYC
jgi:hypothetical protein